MSCPKYDLTVRAGPSIDELKPIAVNDDAHPAHIQTDAFDGFVTVRVRNHPPRTSAYFEHSDDTFCIQVVGRFLKQCTADDLIYGNQFERPLRLPTGSSIAVKFAKWFDPGLKSDLYAPKPHAFSPLIVTMNKLKVQSLPRNEPVQWSSSHGEPIVEDVTELSMDLKQPKDRRSFFSIPQNRKSVDISENQVWSMEFSNPYLDFNKFVVKVPGFEVDVLKYWDGQPLRYFAKTRDDSTVYFVVEFELRESADDTHVPSADQDID